MLKKTVFLIAIGVLAVAIILLAIGLAIFGAGGGEGLGSAGSSQSGTYGSEDGFSDGGSVAGTTDSTVIPDGSLAQKIVAIANSQVGNKESGSKDCGPDINKYFRGGRCGLQWCAFFVTWVMKEAGYNIPSIGATRSAQSYFQKKGAWFRTPQPGDMVMFSGASSNSGFHVGIVTAVNGNSFTSIEGNSGRPSIYVKRHNNKVNSSTVVGFGRPL